jgi:hypothetical protein
MPSPDASFTRSYDFIGFGDEVPGILTLVSAAREFYRRTGRRPRTLLMFKGSSANGVGGHLVRGGLAYLDRSNVPLDIRRTYQLPTFGEPCALYQEFISRSSVAQIALDPRKADQALRQMLGAAGVDMLSGIAIESVLREGNTITGIKLTKGETYLGKYFVDATVNAELAQAAGVKKVPGFGTLGLPRAELPVTLVFETEGLTPARLRRVEYEYLKRFSNPNDAEAQGWLRIAAGHDPVLAQRLRQDLSDRLGNLKTMWIGSDYIDVRSKALSIAYHAYCNKKLSLTESGIIFDNGNIALFPDGRMSWNALLLYVNAEQAEQLARNAAKPTPAMVDEVSHLGQWFKSFGANISVRPASELYIRHAGNVTDVMDLLSGAKMLRGGVPGDEALGTFGYPFDVRGGIEGLDDRAISLGLGAVDHLQPPLFNIGIRHALVRSVPNLAVISPASGFDGFACSAGRIVEYNVGVGQGVGIAMALALLSDRTLASISNREVRSVLAATGKLSRSYPINYAQAANQLLALETSLMDTANIA